MKNQINNILLMSALGLLTISLIGNYFQHSMSKPVIETVFLTDTLVQVDTIIHTVTQHVTIDRPVPVYIDTTANIRTYRDTVFFPYGTIQGEQVVFGELLKRDLQFDLKIPEVYRTLEINNTVSRSVRNRMLFTTVGVRTDFDHHASPVFGVAFIPSGNRYLFGLEVGLDKHISATVGVAVLK